jgi:sugar lactone lactonase YvrE
MMQERNQMKTNINRLLKYPLLALVTGLAVFAALWTMPGTAQGQVVGGDLFATTNLGGTWVNGASPLYQYTPQYVPPGGTPGLFASALDTPRGLAFDGAGNLYVTTNTNVDASVDPPTIQGTILKITSGGLMSTFATGFPVGFLQGLATDSAGDVFISSLADVDGVLPSTLYKITPDGTLSSFALLPSSGWGLAFDSAGNLYVATADADVNGAILKFAPDGTSTTFIGAADFPNSGGAGPLGLAFDASGNLFVSTFNGNDLTGEIRKFGPDGTEITPRFATGLTQAPRGLALDSAGNLFVAEIGLSAPGDILEFTPGGTQTVFASQNFGTRGNRGPEWLAFTTGAVTPPTTAVTLTLPDATEPLTATVTYIDQNSVPPPPSDFELTGSINLTFDITTTATPTPPIIIAFTVPPSLAGQTLSALHYDCTQDPPNCNWVDSTIKYVCDTQGCNWVDSTDTLHPAGQDGYPSSPAQNTVYASVNSLSPFLIAKFKYAAQVQQPINANGTSVFNARRGVIPVAFKLTSDGVPTCALPPATISVFRTSGGVVGSVDESVYLLNSDTGSNFRISNCQYVYNLGSRSLGPGTYLVNISIGGSVTGSATFALK